jgi:SAM-dependent methyltransferase
MTLEWTGERHIPGAGGATISYEHVHRYLLAQSLAHGRRVLDLASGEGYGVDLLGRRAATVVGLEIDVKTVAHASRKYQRSNLAFLRGDIRNVPTRSNAFDLVVCFEAIEHVTRPELALAEARRVLRDDGLLVMSTPERKQYSDSRGYHNEFHEHEFYEDEFLAFLQDVFPHVELYGQRLIGASALWPLTESELERLECTYTPSSASQGSQANRFPAHEYCVAICGGVNVDVHHHPARALSLLIDPQQMWVEEHDQAIRERANLEYRVLELETHSELLLSTKAKQEEALAEAVARVEVLSAHRDNLSEEIRALHSSTSWRLTRPLRAVSARLRARRHPGE